MMTPSDLLPVPPLAETAARYLQWVRPLLDDEGFAGLQQRTARFVGHEGAILQQKLLHFADSKQESSWLIDGWLNTYLSAREPLPLVSNVGFAVAAQGRLNGIWGLANWLAAAAAVHADYLRGYIAAEVTPQGKTVCMRQWQVLQGAMRIAEAGCDRYEFAAPDAANRHIGIFWHGYYYRLEALDAAGLPHSAESFQTALVQITGNTVENPYPVTVPTLSGSGQWAEIRLRLLEHAHNDKLLAQMKEDLFHVSLLDEAGLSADEELCLATFRSGCWVYKPLSYCFNLASSHLAIHCEHTWLDGGMIKSLTTRILQKSAEPAKPTAASVPVMSRQEWILGETEKQKWSEWLQQYAQKADKMRVSSCETGWPIQPVKGVSQDALIQFALQYAQLRTWGCVRNTYEAVDVSHFQSGRTECIRPLSAESLALVRALSENKADTALLQAALSEHKNRVKACKTGHGVNRHMLGLQWMANQYSVATEWFDEPAYQLLTEDFLSTSTLGDGNAILRFAFAPTSKGGLGINYTMLPQSWLLTITHTQSQENDVQCFQTAFKEGACKLCTLAFG
ncbi:choline/carnitine O-acyltransferase [Neisseria iguanae]|uniref:Carnitine acyltransferase n=1 Tax=Neisseria iguanae TaxID=90242 RepID=A0A2P7U136_9NEIS|nr:choline/carnitine O-acyltransferase [Neisseria iguanae]PSJ80686.1 carnitine acyltransferase [Neisseria iguanae]